jgi:uncharacterized protein
MTAAPPPRTSHLLYLHGFRSSPQSAKALRVAQRVAEKHPGVVWCCPQLPPSPREAAEMCLHLTEGWPPAGMAVIGSSLGGFYARWLSLRRGCRAALLNPAPFPQRDLARHIGEHPVWHHPHERVFFQPTFIQELEQLAQDMATRSAACCASPDSLWALVSERDEVLDWREMLAFCAGGTVKRLPEGDHAISDFEQHADELFEFLRMV